VEIGKTSVWEIMQALAAPFREGTVSWKPQTLSKDGAKALACAYIDARVVMSRLDEVLGIDNWQDSYDFLPDGSVLCRLQIRLPGGEWIVKSDVGSESDQKDIGDRHKAAVSDALKRAAVKVGVGRFLYDLPQAWADFDPKKRAFVHEPKLPAWAEPVTWEQLKKLHVLYKQKGFSKEDLERHTGMVSSKYLSRGAASELIQDLEGRPNVARQEKPGPEKPATQEVK
jgi:hypothetical protein